MGMCAPQLRSVPPGLLIRSLVRLALTMTYSSRPAVSIVQQGIIVPEIHQNILHVQLDITAQAVRSIETNVHVPRARTIMIRQGGLYPTAIPPRQGIT